MLTKELCTSTGFLSALSCSIPDLFDTHTTVYIAIIACTIAFVLLGELYIDRCSLSLSTDLNLMFIMLDTAAMALEEALVPDSSGLFKDSDLKTFLVLHAHFIFR